MLCVSESSVGNLDDVSHIVALYSLLQFLSSATFSISVWKRPRPGGRFTENGRPGRWRLPFSVPFLGSRWWFRRPKPNFPQFVFSHSPWLDIYIISFGTRTTQSHFKVFTFTALGVLRLKIKKIWYFDSKQKSRLFSSPQRTNYHFTFKYQIILFAVAARVYLKLSTLEGNECNLCVQFAKLITTVHGVWLSWAMTRVAKWCEEHLLFFSSSTPPFPHILYYAKLGLGRAQVVYETLGNFVIIRGVA